MAGRRRPGISSVQNKAAMQAMYQSKGDELAKDQLERFAQQLDTFTRRLEEFASKHRDEIRKNSNFRRHFQAMCAAVGVDPLACTSKGFWASKLGVGDFYYELAVQIVEVCLATSHLNGGMMTLDDLRNRLLKSRSKTRKDPISSDDIIHAVKKLKVLGHGFELLPLGGVGRYLIQSIPGELSMDDTRIFQLAEEAGGRVTVNACVESLRWDKERTERVLKRLVRMERAWIDEQASDAVHYWFPSLFLEQYNQIISTGNGFEASTFVDAMGKPIAKQTVSGACNKCGYVGHLPYQCRNTIPIEVSGTLKRPIDISSTSSPSTDSDTPLKREDRKRKKKSIKELKKELKRLKKKSSKKRKRSSSTSSADSSSDSDSKSRKRKKQKKEKSKRSKSSKKHKRHRSSSSSSSD
ncbi:Vacuolar-sorting protein SNF8 [Aphelenchoides besseyi]|nr:Vacuolar-sorting protein SNF8 [Aphelenchoides besseyi]